MCDALHHAVEHQVDEDEDEEDVVGRHLLAEERVRPGIDDESGLPAREVAPAEQQVVERQRERQRDDPREDDVE